MIKSAEYKARRMMFERKAQRIKRKEENEKRCCSVFGCGKTLSITESLAGNKCTGCLDVKPLISDKNISWIVKNK